MASFRIMDTENDVEVATAGSLSEAARKVESRMRRSGRLNVSIVGPKSSYWPLGNSDRYSSFLGWENEDGEPIRI